MFDIVDYHFLCRHPFTFCIKRRLVQVLDITRWPHFVFFRDWNHAVQLKQKPNWDSIRFLVTGAVITLGRQILVRTGPSGTAQRKITFCLFCMLMIRIKMNVLCTMHSKKVARLKTPAKARYESHRSTKLPKNQRINVQTNKIQKKRTLS